MYNKEIKAAPLCAWLMAAMSAPLAIAVAGQDYLPVLIVTVGCGLICWCVYLLSRGKCSGKRWYCTVQVLWLIVAVGVSANWANACWQTQGSLQTVPLVLLALAALSAWDGAERASRVGGAVFWLLALLYAVILIAGVGNLKLSWLAPSMGESSPMLIFTLLLPVVITFLPRVKKSCAPVLPCIEVFGLLLTVWTLGTISPKTAKAVAFPFYEYSKSMNLFGVARRLEAVVSVALTMGIYSLMSLLLSAAGHLAENVRRGTAGVGIVVCAVGGAVLMNGISRLPQAILGGGALLIWGVLPLIAHKPTKTEKNENCA